RRGSRCAVGSARVPRGRVPHAARNLRRADSAAGGAHQRARVGSQPAQDHSPPRMTVARDLELYLVRHAPAAQRGPDWPDDGMSPWPPDVAEKFRKTVAGMAAFGVEIDLILTSPLVRCRQTAELLATGLPGRPRTQAIDSLARGARAAALDARG